jgi:hypothetical protein
MSALTVRSRGERAHCGLFAAAVGSTKCAQGAYRPDRCSLPLRFASLAHAGAALPFDAKFRTAVNRVRETLTTWVERGRGYICVRRSRDA